MVKGCLALKFKFDKKVGRSEEKTGLNEVNLGIAPGKVDVRKIVKFIYIGRKFFMRQENKFKKAAFRR